MEAPVTIGEEALAILDGSRAVALDLAAAQVTLGRDLSEEVGLAVRVQRLALALVNAVSASGAGGIELPRRDPCTRPGEVSAVLGCLFDGRPSDERDIAT